MKSKISEEITESVKIDGATYTTLHESHRVEKVGDVMRIYKSDSPSRAKIIERVKQMLSSDWHKADGCDHLRGITDYDDAYEGYVFQGATAELINLFSITKEELK